MRGVWLCYLQGPFLLKKYLDIEKEYDFCGHLGNPEDIFDRLLLDACWFRFMGLITCSNSQQVTAIKSATY